MFSFLRPNKVTLSVALDRLPARYQPGEAVRAAVTLKTPATLVVREARVVLLRRERYECRDGEDADDDDSHTSTSALRFCRTDELDYAGKVIMRDAVIPAGATRTFDFDAAIPSAAYPTWRGGQILDLAWLVSAIVEPEHGAAITAEAEALVASAPEPRDDSGGEFGQSSDGGVAALAFSLRGKEWLTGAPIEGHLVVRPRQDVEMAEVRVELERIESVPYGTGNSVGDKRSARLAAAARLTGGQTLALPFALAVPHPSPVSGATENASVRWLLRGVLEQGYLRPDIRVEQEIAMFAGSGA